MQTFAYSQVSGSPDLARTDSTRSTQTTSSCRRPSAQGETTTRRPSTKPASLQLNSTINSKPVEPKADSTSAFSILSSLNRKLDRLLDEIRENGYVRRGSKHLVEVEDAKSLPPTPLSGKALELTYLIPKPLSSTKTPNRGESQRRKLPKPAAAWKRIGSSDYRFI